MFWPFGDLNLLVARFFGAVYEIFDTFPEADGTLLDADGDWNVQSSDIEVRSGKAQVASGDFLRSANHVQELPAGAKRTSADITFDKTESNKYARLLTGLQTPGYFGTGYAGQLGWNGTQHVAIIAKWPSATTVSLVGLGDLGDGPFNLAFEFESGAQRVYVDGVLKLSATDTTNTTVGNWAGLSLHSKTTADNFRAR